MSPFGLPFDLGVLFGVAMVVVALLMARRGGSNDG